MAIKRSFWNTDWFTALMLALGFLFFSSQPFLQRFERITYDIGLNTTHRDAGDDIAIIAIDDTSIKNLGRWPWARNILAEVLHDLDKAKAVGLTILLSEAQKDPGLTHLRQLQAFYDSSGLSQEIATPGLQEKLYQLDNRISQSIQSLETDQQLSSAIHHASNVFLPMQLTLGAANGQPDNPLTDSISQNRIVHITDTVSAVTQQQLPIPAKEIIPPLPLFSSAARGLGHLVTLPEFDGIVRTEPLAVKYYDQYYPSLALQLATRALNLSTKDLQLKLGEGLQLGDKLIRTNHYLEMQTFFYQDKADKTVFPTDSFYDVLTGKLSLKKYENKIVLIGSTAYGVGTSQSTPVAKSMAPVVTLAHTIASILNEDFIVHPSWGTMLETLVSILIILYLVLLLGRLNARPAALFSLLLLLFLIGGEIFMIAQHGIWLKLTLPALFLLMGHLLITSRHYFQAEQGKNKSEAQSAENNHMLGLAFQQQGHLDWAFEKFRNCPVDNSLMESLYNLALDFERKRQFSKAASVYQYMSDFDSNFRDLASRRKRALQLEDTLILGSASLKTSPTLLLDEQGDMEKPMLGRYRIEKEIGKGAMGKVYQGRDEKINRVVAIKTLPLAEEFDEADLEEVKTRFFREAETAGKLNHPNIVTIYDAGEEHDLAYIAMEFLPGHDLTRYTKLENLLPLPLVMGMIYKAAKALNYAHENGVIHRDIKPANMMFEPEKKKVKLTDFGIARIANSSKTRTGTILGTPSYMSPEQLAGEKVDGRSDLFSLGVLFYQLVTGALPFKGESLAMLMYLISNEPHTDLFEACPELKETKPCLKPIIDQILAKEAADRFQSGAEFAEAIKNCAQTEVD